MNKLQRYYKQFLSLLRDIEPLDNFPEQIRKSRLLDNEFIALSLAVEA